MYSLGDYGNAEDMTRFNATDARLLSVGDFAFVRRSNGGYSYSVIVEAPKAFTSKEPFIKFKLDSKGFTKTIPMTSWAANIQLLKTPESIQTTEPIKTHSSRRVSWAGSIRQNRSKDAIGKDKPVAHTTTGGLGRRKSKRRVSCAGNLQHSQKTNFFLSALASINHDSSFLEPYDNI
jgi:hypothetical protein